MWLRLMLFLCRSRYSSTLRVLRRELAYLELRKQALYEAIEAFEQLTEADR